MTNIELGGRNYELNFTGYSLWRLEEKTGMSVQSFFEAGDQRGVHWMTVHLLWSCLVAKHELTVDQVARMLPIDVKKLWAAAFDEYMGALKGAAEKPDEKQ